MKSSLFSVREGCQGSVGRRKEDASNMYGARSRPNPVEVWKELGSSIFSLSKGS